MFHGHKYPTYILPRYNITYVLDGKDDVTYLHLPGMEQLIIMLIPLIHNTHIHYTLTFFRKEVINNQ